MADALLNVGTLSATFKIAGDQALLQIRQLTEQLTQVQRTAEKPMRLTVSMKESADGLTSFTAKLDALPASATRAATESTRALGTLSTKLPQAEIERLNGVLAQLPASAVAAAGGTEKALARIQTIEARNNLKVLDSAIKSIAATGVAATAETTRALDTINPRTARLNIDGLLVKMRELPGAAVMAAGGVRGALDGINFEGPKAKMTDFANHVFSMGKRAAEGIGLIALAEGGLDLAALKSASTFQSTTTQVRNNTTMTDADAAAMRQSTLALGPQMGVNPNELAMAYMHAFNLSNNGTVADIIMRTAAESAKSTGDDVTRVTNILAQILHEYGLDKGGPNQQEDATRVMGQAHLAAASANMTLPEFSQNFGQISAWAANLHVPMDQAMATYAMMTKHGFDPAEAATQVKDIFPHIIKPAAGALKEAGSLDKRVAATGQDDGTSVTSLLSAETLSKIGLSGIFDELHKKFEVLGLDEAQQTAEIMKLIPNIRGGAATFTAIGQGAADYRDILASLNDKTLVMNVTHDAFERTQKTVGFQWDRLKESVRVATIELGDKMLPTVTRLVTAFTNQLPGALTAFGNTITGLGNSGGMSPLAKMFDSIAHGVVIARDSVKTFAEAITGNWTEAPGINSFTFKIGQLGNFFRDHLIPAVKQFVEFEVTQVLPVWEKVGAWLMDTGIPAFGRFMDGVSRGVTILRADIETWRGWYEALADWFYRMSGHADDLEAAIGRFFDAVGTHINAFKDMVGGIIGPGGVVGSFFDALGSKADDITSAVGRFFDALGTHANAFRENMVTPMHIIGQEFDLLGSKVNEWFGPGGKIGQFFDNVGTKAHALYDASLGIVFGKGGKIGVAFDALGGVANDWFSPGGKIGSFFDNVGTKAHGLYDGSIGLIFGKGGSVGVAFDATGSVASDWFAPGGKIGQFFDNVGTKANALKEAVTGAFSSLEEWFGGWASRIGAKVLEPFQAIGSGIHAFLVKIGDAVNWVGGLFDFPAIDFSGIPGFAGGLDGKAAGWGGGMAVVGEKGPEVMYVPAGANIATHEQSKALGLLPGFAGGLGDVFGGIVNAAKGAKDKVGELLGKGEEWIVSQATSKFGAFPAHIGELLGNIGKYELKESLDGIKKLIHEAFSSLPKAQNLGSSRYGGSGFVGMALDAFLAYMSAYGGPLDNESAFNDLMSVGRETNTNPRWFMAIMQTENGFGTAPNDRLPSVNNYGGMGMNDRGWAFDSGIHATDGGPEYAGYNSFHDFLEDEAAWMAANGTSFAGYQTQDAGQGKNAAFQQILAAIPAIGGSTAAGPFNNVAGGWPAVVDQAMQRVGHFFQDNGDRWWFWCEKFVNDMDQAAGFPPHRYETAKDHDLSSTLNSGMAPPGASWYWSFDPAGHTAISTGDGGLIGTFPDGVQYGNISQFNGDPDGWLPPGLKDGGYFPGNDPRLAVIGEGRHDEIVAPLPMLREVVRTESGSRIEAGAITIHVHPTPGMSEERVAQLAAEAVYDVMVTGPHQRGRL